MADPDYTHARDRLCDPANITLFDGAVGTVLYARGVFINQCFDELSLKAPDMVRDVHREYVAAGADAIETNTFGANANKLAQFGLEGQVAEINRRAAELAREATAASMASQPVLVGGAVGPLGLRIEPYGPTSRDEARAMFAEQMIALAEGGCDHLVIETFGDLHELEEAIAAARTVVPDLPVIAQVTIGSDLRTSYGACPGDVALALDRLGADVIGLNCSVGPQVMLQAIEQMVPITKRPLSAMPNAGSPREIGGRRIYLASAEYFASYARHLVHAGASVVGGCCGTTPEHTHAMAQALRAERAMQRSATASTANNAGGGGSTVTVGEAREPGACGSGDVVTGVEPVVLAERSRLGAKLAAGEFVSTVEIVPPRGVDVSSLLRDAKTLHERGVDAINVPDGPRAQSRMGAIATSLLIEQRVGIESVTHYCCRDRNLLGMLSDLLGASALGLRNLLIITGDPPKMGPYPDATAVFDIDSIGLTNMVAALNRGLDPGGNALGDPTQFAIGVGVNPGAIDEEEELRRFAWKLDAGAEYAITQPVFDEAQIEHFLERTEGQRVPIIAGIWPLVSARNAEFLANEVPGVVVPDAVLERMRAASAKSREHAVQEGLAIARDMVDRIKPGVQGVQVSAPFGRVELALDVFEGAAWL